jgi:biopolymer transport protein TolQ
LRTVGTFALALVGLGQAAPGGAVEHDVVSLVARSGPVAMVVLVILVLFSVLSWAITVFKWREFQRARAHTTSFLEVFRKSSKFSEVQAVCSTLTSSPLVGLFQSGYAELTAQMRPIAQGATSETRPGTVSQRPTLRSLDAIDRALLRAAAVELNRLERRVTFLATTASISPFIGLFGTVWGIMTAFQDIGATGASNLAVVAPGIAHALIATAAGLFAAIPAVYFYNVFTYRVKLFAAEMDDFALDFLNICERNFT